LKGMASASACCSLAWSAISVSPAVGWEGPLTVVPAAVTLPFREWRLAAALAGCLARFFRVGMIRCPSVDIGCVSPAGPPGGAKNKERLPVRRAAVDERESFHIRLACRQLRPPIVAVAAYLRDAWLPEQGKGNGGVQ